jgi:mersacidin/lichenicidin family type 2 lantibiotic
MSAKDIIRTWKDEEYRQNLIAAHREDDAPNPAGFPELSDTQLKQAAGGFYAPSHGICPTCFLCTHILSRY